jgi:hypothetical protein
MGLIRDRKQTTQGIDFQGIERGKIHPSDVDAVLEFDNRALILIEVKRKGNNIPTGQRLLLERIADKWEVGIVLKVEHEVYNTDIDIPLSECKVTAMYHKGEWFGYRNDLSQTLLQLGKRFNINKLL